MLPEIRLSKVVLPDPLGPITPTISPLPMPKETSETAVSPPNRLVRALTSSSIALSPESGRQRSDDASRHQQYGQNQDAAINNGAHFRAEMDNVGQRGDHEGADHRGGYHAPAAEQHHRHDGERLIDRQEPGLDETEIERIEAARDCRDEISSCKCGQL